MKKWLIIVTALLMQAATGFLQKSHAQDIDYSPQASILFQLIKYFEWPANAGTGEITIGVGNNYEVFSEFSRLMNGRKIAGKPIVVKRVSVPADAENCEVIFYPQSDIDIKTIRMLESKPALIITESADLLKSGTCVNFLKVNNLLKIELNKVAIQKKNIKIATELLALVQ